MNFDSYITSETKTAFSVPLACPPYSNKGFERLVKFFKGQRKGFTLAETLITLTIIGVVAALTIPSLISEYQKHTYVTGLKKAYSNLQNAIQMIPISQGCPAGDFECAGLLEWENATNIDGQDFGGDRGKKLIYLLSKQFKTTKIDYEAITTVPDYEHYAGGFQTEDGMIISSAGHSFSIVVDVNGDKGPNIPGRDRFIFGILKWTNQWNVAQPLIPGGEIDDYYGTPSDCTTQNVKKDSTDGYNCTVKVLREGKMDY